MPKNPANVCAACWKTLCDPENVWVLRHIEVQYLNAGRDR